MSCEGLSASAASGVLRFLGIGVLGLGMAPGILSTSVAFGRAKVFCHSCGSGYEDEGRRCW